MQTVYLVIVVSLMSSILWVHEPDVRGAKDLPGESKRYASDGCRFLKYLQCLSLWCLFDYEWLVNSVRYLPLGTSEGLR